MIYPIRIKYLSYFREPLQTLKYVQCVSQLAGLRMFLSPPDLGLAPSALAPLVYFLTNAGELEIH